MFAIFSSGTELRRFRKGVLPKIALVVLLFIPLIYGALYLWAFWAPDKELSNLSVALVNEDAGATRDGTPVRAGDDIVTELLDGADLNWHPTTAQDAAAGVHDGDYYFAVTIPANFSESAISAGTDHPVSAEVKVTYNDSNSFLATVLGKQAMTQLRDVVATQVGDQNVTAVLEGLTEAGDGIRSAADGAATLADGLDTAVDGSDRLVVGLNSLADGAGTLNSGVAKLGSGASTLSNGLDTLAGGASTLATKSGELAAGASQVATGMQAAADGAGTLADKAHQLAGGATAIADGTTALQGGTNQVAGGLDELVATIQAVPAGTDVKAFLPALHKLQAGAHATDSGAAEAATKTREYAALSGQFAGGSAELAQKLAAGAPGAAQLAAGAEQLQGGAAQLSTGATSAASGSHSLVDGIAALSQGSGKLVAGSSELVDGGAALQDGATQLADGSHELSDKLAEGGDKVPNLTPGQIDDKAQVIADPVVLDQSWQNESTSFGEGFAPFFIALATFVGGLITWLILRALPMRALATAASGLRTTMTGFLPAMVIGLGQTVIMVLVLIYGIGLEPNNWLGMSAFMLLATLSFLALQQMFIIVFGSAAGRVISLVLLMLMLTSSGGTYPVETTPAFFQALHPFMPASYVVSGLRQLITGGVDFRLWVSVAVLAAVLVGSLAISAWSAAKQRTWTVGRLHPELTI